MSGERAGAAAGGQWLSVPQVVALAEQHLQAGRVPAAEDLCRQVLRSQPHHAGALHLMGVIMHQRGQTAAAIDLVRQAIAGNGSVALFHTNLGEMCRLSGRLDEAVAAGRRAIALQPDYPQALNNLGIAYFDQKDFAAAEEHYRRAIARAPGFAEAHSNLGNALRAQRRLEEAIPSYEQAIRLQPGFASAYNNMGTALRDLKRQAEAEAAYRKALALNPRDPSILNNLALAVADQKRLDEAVALLANAVSLDPGNHESFTYLASVRIEQKKLAEARAAVERALALRPQHPEALNVRGRILFEERRTEEALASYDEALAASPDFADAYNNKGNVLRELGRFEEASAAFGKAIELSPSMTAAYLNLADGHKFTSGDAYLAAMDEMAGKMGSMAETEQSQLHFALSKAYADIGERERGFRHLLQGNALKRKEVWYDEAATFALFDRIAQVFTPELIASRAGMGHPSPVPVLVMGMPRSGTTLVEQILASHPKVFGAGELHDLGGITAGIMGPDGRPAPYPDLAVGMGAEQLRRFGAAYLERLRQHSADAERITDKLPANFLYAGLFHMALPHARIVHLMRDPVDTCLSCFSKLFSGEQNHTYDLAELGRYYRRYLALMEHWRRALPPGVMLDVQYEEVVADLEGQARRIIAHCGLDWDDACLAFHETKRPVRTASASQVRKPIYKSSVGRWLPYKDLLQPLLAELRIDPPG